TLPQSHSRGGKSSLTAPRSLINRSHQHKHRENHPEKELLPIEQKAAANPEPLPGVQQPGSKESRQRRYRHRPQCPHSPQLKVGWIKEELHHEVLPIDINAAPKISEARSKELKMV